MAFRKTVKSHWQPNLCCHGCGEVQYVPSSASGSTKKTVRSFKNLDEISKTTLPVIDADSLLKSGRKIEGTVSFFPSDVSNIESSAVDALSDYASRFSTDFKPTESTESTE